MRLIPLCLAASLAWTTYASSRYSTWMLESIISRGEGISSTDGLLGGIQKGLFQEALRAAVNQADDLAQATRWSDYHHRSVTLGVKDFHNATADSLAPLDRLCAGRSLLESGADEPAARKALKALRKSLDLQLRSENGGFWYFVDPPPPYESYGNLSYSDGMYGYAPFVTLYGKIYGDEHLNIDAALCQLEIIHRHCLHKDTGLIVHGYDASRQAPWADPDTGASPIVWGRSLAWYAIGLVDTLEIADSSPDLMQSRQYARIHAMFRQLARAGAVAIQRSAHKTGRYGVWQVFDQPGREGNFVEASATAMLVYVLAKGVRLGYLEDGEAAHAQALQTTLGVESVSEVARSTYHDLLAHFVVRSANGTLDFEGTSIIASLHEKNPSYEYYTHRSVVKNSLIGSSAFVLASLEMERL